MKNIKSLILACLLCVFLVPSAFGQWTITSVDIDDVYTSKVGSSTIMWIKAMLISDGAAETDLDLWAVLAATIADDSVQTRLLGTGGILQSIVYRQGAQPNDQDFLLTVYNGTGSSIFSEIISFDEVGSTTIVGGTYDGATTKGFYIPLAKGLVIDVADIGGASDSIILWFVVFVGE